MKKHKCRICHKELRTEHGRHIHETKMHKGQRIPDEEEAEPVEQTFEIVEPEPAKLAILNEKSLDGLKEDAYGFLRLEAESRAEDLGHELGAWLKRSSSEAQATCRTCGRLAVYAGHPPPGGEKVVGPAVSEKCH